MQPKSGAHHKSRPSSIPPPAIVDPITQVGAPGMLAFGGKDRTNLIPVGAEAIKVPNTMALVSNNNPFIANDIMVKDKDTQKKNKKKKTTAKTNIKTGQAALDGLDPVGGVVKARRGLNEADEMEKALDQD